MKKTHLGNVPKFQQTKASSGRKLRRLIRPKLKTTVFERLTGRTRSLSAAVESSTAAKS